LGSRAFNVNDAFERHFLASYTPDGEDCGQRAEHPEHSQALSVLHMHCRLSGWCCSGLALGR
jgi:hypothetical protein